MHMAPSVEEMKMKEHGSKSPAKGILGDAEWSEIAGAASRVKRIPEASFSLLSDKSLVVADDVEKSLEPDWHADSA